MAGERSKGTSISQSQLGARQLEDEGEWLQKEEESNKRKDPENRESKSEQELERVKALFSGIYTLESSFCTTRTMFPHI